MKVDLTDEQIKRMAMVNENWKNIQKLLESNVFDLRNGRAILDFDVLGDIKNVQKIMNYHFKIVKML